VLLWVVAGSGLLIALLALSLARRVSRRLDALNQSYWELRYDYTRLRSQVSRLSPDETASTPEPAEPTTPPATVSFVPLSTIRKKDR
jgi:hypothetical protein